MLSVTFTIPDKIVIQKKKKKKKKIKKNKKKKIKKALPMSINTNKT